MAKVVVDTDQLRITQQALVSGFRLMFAVEAEDEDDVPENVRREAASLRAFVSEWIEV